MKLTENFSLSEFECKCGCKMPKDVFENVKMLAVQLQDIRDCFNARIMINSAYRCVEHNRAIGSNDSSQHILGKAADIVIGGNSPDEVADRIESMITDEEVILGGLGRYNGFTHIDIRTGNRLAKWDNRTV